MTHCFSKHSRYFTRKDIGLNTNKSHIYTSDACEKQTVNIQVSEGEIYRNLKYSNKSNIFMLGIYQEKRLIPQENR